MKNNKLLCIAIGVVVAAILFAYFSICIVMHGAQAVPEEEQIEVIAEPVIEVEQTPVQEIQPLSYMEQKWKEALQQVPPLTKSGGVGSANQLIWDKENQKWTPIASYKFTYYSSNVLYHYRTPEWRLDNNGCYRAWDGSQWCFVISMNSTYGYMGQTLNFDFGSCIVLDSGCATGVVDLYVNW